jgi:perosamine synthetase
VRTFWANKRLDASSGDWWFGVRSCVRAGPDAAAALEARWDPAGAGVMGLSVRSLFDLWLTAQGWEPGDRIVFTAFTVADMPLIARRHGLEVAAVDIDPLTCEPDLDMLRAVVDERTRAVVYTHLFGARGEVDGALVIAHGAGARFVEDCAEAYCGPHWRGDPRSDLALFSFGPIKNATAFGGALARVADGDVRVEMRRRRSAMPRQPRREYLARLVKLGGLAVATHPLVFRRLVRLLDAAGPGHDVVLNRLTRGFPGPDLLGRIRRRPPGAMVRLLDRRLAQGDATIARRVGPGEQLTAALNGVAMPAGHARERSYWLVPVLAPDPDALVRRLATSGFHATRGRAFAVVEHDPGVVARAPVGARTLFEHGVFLPFAPQMPARTIDELAAVVVGELARQERSGVAPAPDVSPAPASFGGGPAEPGSRRSA